MPTERPRQRPARGALLALALLLAPAADAQAFCRLTTANPKPGKDCAEDGLPLEWRRQCLTYSPVRRDTEPPGFDAVLQALLSSFATWLRVECDGAPLGLSIIQTSKLSTCETPQYNHAAGNSNAVLFTQQWEKLDLPQDAFGLTLVWHNPDTGTILDADIAINENMGSMDVCPNLECPPGVIDIQNVVTHEVGHFLGLGHSFSRTSSMFFEARAGETRKRFLNEDDIAGVCSIYGELAEPDCEPEDYTPRGGFRASCYYADDGCSVGPAGHDGAAPWPAALALLGLWIARRRRGR